MEEQVVIKEDIGQIERKIVSVRGRQVILDRDLAALYGVETKSLNQTVRRNLDRFPDDFMFILDLKEEPGLKSQIVTSSWGGNRKPPLAFTEQGVAMLSGLLRSKRAVEANILIMRAFVQMRHLLLSNAHIINRVQRLEEKQEQTFFFSAFVPKNARKREQNYQPSGRGGSPLTALYGPYGPST